ncbi:MAG: helix-turn-helix domain-containing protein, partial [Thermoplasmata archaeon]
IIHLAMSDDEETYSTVFSALRHPVRRRILRILARGPNSFTEIQRDVDVGSSHFNYHLDELGELVVKTEDGRYRLSSPGRAALRLMEGVEEPEPQGRARGGVLRFLGSDLRALALGVVVGILVGLALPILMHTPQEAGDETVWELIDELKAVGVKVSLATEKCYDYVGTDHNVPFDLSQPGEPVAERRVLIFEQGGTAEGPLIRKAVLPIEESDWGGELGYRGYKICVVEAVKIPSNK